MTLDEYFKGKDESRELFEAVCSLIDSIGMAEICVTRSQVAFRRRRAFAWAWRPDKYLRGKTAPLVLTIALPNKDPSPRWKQEVEPYPGHFIHHLELYSTSRIDQEVRNWLHEAWIVAA